MSCVACSGRAENMGSPGSPIEVHAVTGACWDPFYHAYEPRAPRQASVLAVERSFKVSRNGKLVWPWEA